MSTSDLTRHILVEIPVENFELARFWTFSLTGPLTSFSNTKPFTNQVQTPLLDALDPPERCFRRMSGKCPHIKFLLAPEFGESHLLAFQVDSLVSCVPR